MSGLTNAESVATLDARFPVSGATDFIGWSVDGATQFSGLVRTFVGATGWAAATNADPSVKANATTLVTAASTAATTGAGIGFFAVFSASTAGVQRTDWTALSVPKPLAIGDELVVSAAELGVTLT